MAFDTSFERFKPIADFHINFASKVIKHGTQTGYILNIYRLENLVDVENREQEDNEKQTRSGNLAYTWLADLLFSNFNKLWNLLIQLLARSKDISELIGLGIEAGLCNESLEIFCQSEMKIVINRYGVQGFDILDNEEHYPRPLILPKVKPRDFTDRNAFIVTDKD